MGFSPANACPFEIRSLLAELTTATVDEDQQWIVGLMGTHGPAVVGLLWKTLGVEADVLDAYQTCVCKLTAVGPEAIRTNRKAYFFRTAMNAAIEILRARKRQQQHWPAVASVQERRQESPEPQGSLHQREANERLREAICQLPQQLRMVILLRDLAEVPYREVARILGIRVTTARLYRRQAIVRLAELMDEEAC